MAIDGLSERCGKVYLVRRVRLLETSGAIRQYERIANARLTIGLDRCGLMNDSLIVEQQCGPRFEHREAHAGITACLEHTGFAAAHVAALDQDDGDEIHAVAVRPLGRGSTDAFGSIDSKLMRLDVPAL